MAALVGYNGAVKIGANSVALMDSWELSPSANVMDITSFGDSWKVKLSGLKDWTAKVSGKYDFTDTNGQMALWTAFLNGTTVSLELDVDGSHKFTGTAFVKSPPIKVGVDATESVEFDLEGSSALVYA